MERYWKATCLLRVCTSFALGYCALTVLCAVNQHVQDAIGFLQILSQLAYSRLAKANLVSTRRLGSSLKFAAGTMLMFFTILDYLPCCTGSNRVVHTCLFPEPPADSPPPTFSTPAERDALYAAGRADAIAAYNKLCRSEESVHVDAVLTMPFPAVYSSQPAAAAAAAKRSTASAAPPVAPAARSYRVVYPCQLNEDDPVSSNEDTGQQGDGDDDSDDDSSASDDDSFASDPETLAALAAVALDASYPVTECSGEIRDVVASAIAVIGVDVEAAGVQPEPERSAASSASATATDGSSAGSSLPAGKMRVKGRKGPLEEVWVSSILALLVASPRLSADRMMRVMESAKAASALGTGASELDWMVACGTTCAVRYNDRVYYGWLARYGYVNAKAGLTAELSKHVSIHPDKKASGLTFWFVWYEEAVVSGGQQLYVKTIKDTLQPGMTPFHM